MRGLVGEPGDGGHEGAGDGDALALAAESGRAMVQPLGQPTEESASGATGRSAVGVPRSTAGTDVLAARQHGTG